MIQYQHCVPTASGQSIFSHNYTRSIQKSLAKYRFVTEWKNDSTERDKRDDDKWYLKIDDEAF